MNTIDFPRKLSRARELSIDGDYPNALILYGKLMRHRPKNVDIWLEYGGSAMAMEKMDLAEQAWAKVEELHGNNADILQRLGFQYQGARRPEKARQCFEKAAAVDPKHINSRVNLALAYEKNHQIGEARLKVEECLKIDPGDEQARYLSAFLDTRSNQLEQAERQLRDLIASDPKHEYVKYAARYKLAEILDKTQRFDEAMQFLKEAKDLVHALADPKILAKQYDSSVDEKLKEVKKFRKDILLEWGRAFPESERELISRFAFLGGHPRSGTTLLEQVLDAHPEVAAADEPEILRWAITGSFSLASRCSSKVLNVVWRRYLVMLQRNADESSQGKLLLEKNPSPTAMLPTLLKIFPELRVIIALRDPRDVLLSCYFQNIPLNNVNANFLSFERLAKHYADLMGIWLAVREWAGFAWIETRYEDTVANLEKEGQRVTNFLGLDWNESQSKFFERGKKKQLNSPTYHDVTKPIYSHSVGRWRYYEKYMTSILPALEPYCRAFGYS